MKKMAAMRFEQLKRFILAIIFNKNGLPYSIRGLFAPGVVRAAQ